MQFIKARYLCSYVATDLHRNRAWACVWLKRYEKEGLDGLKNKPRTGSRPSELSEEDISQQYKNNAKRKQQSCLDHKTSTRVNHIKKSGIKYHYNHIYPAYFVNGALSKKY